MILFKDYSTGKKSLTVTGLVLSFLVSLAYLIGIFTKVLDNRATGEDVAGGFLALSFMGIFVALYWQKRVKFSKDGLEIADEVIGYSMEGCDDANIDQSGE